MLLNAKGTLGAGTVRISKDYSCFNSNGGLYLEDLNGQGINTSRVVDAWQSCDNGITFQTRSGSIYEVIFNEVNDLKSRFAFYILEQIDDEIEAFKKVKYSILLFNIRNHRRQTY